MFLSVHGIDPDKTPLAVVDSDWAALHREVPFRLTAAERIAVMDQPVKLFFHRKSRLILKHCVDRKNVIRKSAAVSLPFNLG